MLQIKSTLPGFVHRRGRRGWYDVASLSHPHLPANKHKGGARDRDQSGSRAAATAPRARLHYLCISLHITKICSLINFTKYTGLKLEGISFKTFKWRQYRGLFRALNMWQFEDNEICSIGMVHPSNSRNSGLSRLSNIPHFTGNFFLHPCFLVILCQGHGKIEIVVIKILTDT